MPRRQPSIKAFSLVEIAVVMAIIGLLVGGVLAGQSLIRASELRSVSQEQQQIAVAAKNFRNKYSYLPGDLPTATENWGSTMDCLLITAASDLTCNGDGDHLVRSPYSPDIVTGGALAGFPTVDESITFWQHLVLGGFLPSTANSMRVNRLSSWAVDDLVDPISNRNNMFSGTYSNLIYSRNANLTPEELWNIDTKMDDGKPATGKLVLYAGPALGATPNLSTCSDSTVAPRGNNLAASYLLSAGSVKACQLIFKDNFNLP